jgi:hypothetical protein
MSKSVNKRELMKLRSKVRLWRILHHDKSQGHFCWLCLYKNELCSDDVPRDKNKNCIEWVKYV